ncbi:unnamed protein product [Soboliphyme baturini]|uniref:BtpA family membrane complex biogenesis protein n=1 Tax=Soboliphyme baturini TaxID=241478 RepID=A0A183INQ3_9BILA|nr:unnamed protein product [Soboliphyme baturini]
MGDVPYVRPADVGPETISFMTRMAIDVKRSNDKRRNLIYGISFLASCNHYDFIRAEGFIFSHVADEGFIDACAGPLLRYRRMIGADHIAVLTDIKKKHSSHSITADVSSSDTAEAAKFFLSDGVIITGKKTGSPPSIQDFLELRNGTSLPVIIGSGVTDQNVSKFAEADALIVGSYFKKDGIWSNDVEFSRVKRLVDVVKEIRQEASA